MYERPRIGLAVIVKTINGVAPMVLLSYYLCFCWISTLRLRNGRVFWGLPLSLTVFNIIFGWMGDKVVFARLSEFLAASDRCRFADCLLGADDMGA